MGTFREVSPEQKKPTNKGAGALRKYRNAAARTSRRIPEKLSGEVQEK
jgi:hypothetical protein